MALNTNTFRTRRYLRTKFKEGKYLLASEGSDLQLETIDLIREFIKLSYGNFAVGQAFYADQTAADELTIRPGYAWNEGVPFLLKSGTDSKVILGTVPSGVALSDGSKTTIDDGGKVLDVSGLANGNYSIVCEAVEELVKPSGTGAVDTFLQGVNVDEETANKSRLIYKLHVVETSTLSSTPTFPIVGTHYVNEISVTPTGGANFVITASDISQDVNGADRQVIFDNAAGNLPYGSNAADYINGLLIDSDGNEMVITSVTTTDGGATVRFLLDREVDYNSSNPKAGWPVITTNVPYRLVKADFYVTSTSGVPLGRHYWRLADFTMTGASVTSLTDQRTITEVNSFETDHNLAMVGGGDLSWDLGSNEFSFTADLKVTIPGVAGNAVIDSASSPITIATNGHVAYILLDRYASIDYTVSPVVVAKSQVPNNVNVFIVLERADDRILVAGNCSLGDQDSALIGTTPDPRAAAIPPIGSIIPFYDFNALVTFNTDYWVYCDGSVISDVDSPLNGQTTPDLSNRYLVGFGTDGGGDIDTAAWATGVVGLASHLIDLRHTHPVDPPNTTSGGASTSTTSSSGSHSHPLSEAGRAMWTFTESGVDGDIHWRRSNISSSWTSNRAIGEAGLDNRDSQTPISFSGSGHAGIGLDGDTDSGGSHTHTLAHTHDLNIGSFNSSNPNNTGPVPNWQTVSIQPRSVRVRFIMRKV